MPWKLPHPAFAELIAALATPTQPVYIVGGVVRDLLLGQNSKSSYLELTDLDLVVEHSALTSARRAADRLGWSFYALDEARDVARLIFNPSAPTPLVCDIAGMRGGSIEVDLRLRDFTINAMALAYAPGDVPGDTPTLLDPTGGQADLARKIVRRVAPVSLCEDVVRVLRAVRLAVQFSFQIESATAAQMQRLVPSLPQASSERVRDELWKLFATANPAAGIKLAQELGMIAYLLPEVAATLGVTQSSPHYLDVFEHTHATVEAAAHLRQWLRQDRYTPQTEAEVELIAKLGPWRHRLRHHLSTNVSAHHQRGDWLIWVALLHDIGKPATRSEEMLTASNSPRIRFLNHEEVGAEFVRQRLNQLRFSRNEVELASAIVQAHMRPHHLHASFAGQPISRRASYRFFRDLNRASSGPHAAIDTLLLALCDQQAIYPTLPPAWGSYLDHVVELLDFAFAPAAQSTQPLVDGHLLMQQLAIKPGRQLGDLLEHLLEAQVVGEISTREEALALAAGWLGQNRS